MRSALPIRLFWSNLSGAEPRSDSATFSACMPKLYANLLILTVSEFHDTFQWLHLRVQPETAVLKVPELVILLP